MDGGGRGKKRRPPELLLTRHEFTDDMRHYSQSMDSMEGEGEARGRRRWTRVKEAFLAPQAREDEDISQSLPSSPNLRAGSIFFYDDHILLESSKSNQSDQVTREGLRKSYIHYILDVRQSIPNLRDNLVQKQCENRQTDTARQTN